MDTHLVVSWLGYILAAYAVVGNDVIQTLGTFLTSNEKRPWWVLWLYAGSLLTVVLVIGYLGYGNHFGLGGDDIAFDRLDKLEVPNTLPWYFVIPPLALMLLTRIGIPVSTTFFILTFFSTKSLPGMIQKSVMGYLIAFGIGIVMYSLLTRVTEKKFLENPLSTSADGGIWTSTRFWVTAQWFSTGFLWVQWLSQDLANIYIYLGKDTLSLPSFIVSYLILILFLGVIFYSKGGKIQDIVKQKSNTGDIRAATFIDLMFGFILLIFKQNILGLWDAKLPMSTTWVFIGLLAGREIAISYFLDLKLSRKEFTPILLDLFKVFLGLVISVALVYIIKFISTM